MDFGLFDEVAEALRSLVPGDFGTLRTRARRYGVKVWFDVANPPREHYEAQVIGPTDVPGATVLALELGFHAEQPDPATNESTLQTLLGREKTWRRTLGAPPVAGPFIGRPDDWRRVSETWPDPDLDDPELPIELATRLTDYISALEPLRRRAP
jgi:hypothetical protein